MTKAPGIGHRAAGGEKTGERRVGRGGWWQVRCGLIAACAATVLALGGCDWLGPTRVDSPYTGQPATAAEIAAQRSGEADKAALAAREQADRMAANLRAEADAARSEQARRKAELDRAVASLDAETRIRLADLQAQYETATLESTDRLARMQADTERAVATIAARTESKLADIAASAEAALARIESIDAAKAFGLDLAAQGAALVPGGGDLLAAAVAGLGGVLLGRVGRKSAEDRAWDEATLAANAARDKADTLYDQGKRESEIAKLLAAVISGGPQGRGQSGQGGPPPAAV